MDFSILNENESFENTLRILNALEIKLTEQVKVDINDLKRTWMLPKVERVTRNAFKLFEVREQLKHTKCLFVDEDHILSEFDAVKKALSHTSMDEESFDATKETCIILGNTLKEIKQQQNICFKKIKDLEESVNTGIVSLKYNQNDISMLDIEHVRSTTPIGKRNCTPLNILKNRSREPSPFQMPPLRISSGRSTPQEITSTCNQLHNLGCDTESLEKFKEVFKAKARQFSETDDFCGSRPSSALSEISIDIQDDALCPISEIPLGDVVSKAFTQKNYIQDDAIQEGQRQISHDISTSVIRQVESNDLHPTNSTSDYSQKVQFTAFGQECNISTNNNQVESNELNSTCGYSQKEQFKDLEQILNVPKIDNQVENEELLERSRNKNDNEQTIDNQLCNSHELDSTSSTKKNSEEKKINDFGQTKIRDISTNDSQVENDELLKPSRNKNDIEQTIINELDNSHKLDSTSSTKNNSEKKKISDFGQTKVLTNDSQAEKTELDSPNSTGENNEKKKIKDLKVRNVSTNNSQVENDEVSKPSRNENDNTETIINELNNSHELDSTSSTKRNSKKKKISDFGPTKVRNISTNDTQVENNELLKPSRKDNDNEQTIINELNNSHELDFTSSEKNISTIDSQVERNELNTTNSTGENSEKKKKKDIGQTITKVRNISINDSQVENDGISKQCKTDNDYEKIINNELNIPQKEAWSELLETNNVKPNKTDISREMENKTIQTIGSSNFLENKTKELKPENKNLYLLDNDEVDKNIQIGSINTDFPDDKIKHDVDDFEKSYIQHEIKEDQKREKKEDSCGLKDFNETLSNEKKDIISQINLCSEFEENISKTFYVNKKNNETTGSDIFDDTDVEEIKIYKKVSFAEADQNPLTNLTKPQSEKEKTTNPAITEKNNLDSISRSFLSAITKVFLKKKSPEIEIPLTQSRDKDSRNDISLVQKIGLKIKKEEKNDIADFDMLFDQKNIVNANFNTEGTKKEEVILPEPQEPLNFSEIKDYMGYNHQKKIKSEEKTEKNILLTKSNTQNRATLCRDYAKPEDIKISPRPKRDLFTGTKVSRSPSITLEFSEKEFRLLDQEYKFSIQNDSDIDKNLHLSGKNESMKELEDLPKHLERDKMLDNDYFFDKLRSELVKFTSNSDSDIKQNEDPNKDFFMKKR